MSLTRKTLSGTVAVAALLLLAGPGSSRAAGQNTPQDAPYRFGVVPQFHQTRLFQTWSPILEELERRTGVRFELLGSPSIPEFERRFLTGIFDCAYMNPYHLVRAHQAEGYLPIVRDHSRPLQGILVVRKDSPVHAVEELDGQTLAFPAPNALGASLLMRTELHDRVGIAITPRYVKTHTSVYLNVIKARMPAGGGVMRTLNEQPPAVHESLRVVYRTQAVPAHPIACHPRVGPKLRSRLRAALLAMARGPEAGLLAEVPIHRPGPAAYREYQMLEKLGLERYYVRD